MNFRLLGPLEVLRDGERVPLGGPKQRLVLAHLLIRANEVVSADRLIDEIWGDEPPDAARPSLHSYVSHLRKALGAERLEGRPPGYVLHASDDEVDARAFESLVTHARRRMSADPVSAARVLRQALALWHGEPLADLSSELSLQPEITRLSEMRLSAQEDLFDAELALGRHAELIPELERLVGRHALRERLSGHLMLALYRAGRQAEALAAYHRLRTALDEELGLEPSAILETLQRQILNQDRGLELRGEPLRGYRIIGQLASGPLGVVQRALDPHTEREVAIKAFAEDIANDADFVRTFDADASRVARLEHPNLVPLLDWWREPDAAYLVMRLMTGGSLADRLARGRVSSALALHWAEQIGGALAAAHRQEVIHGDVRPGNVLFDADENAYLSDFSVGTDLAARGGDVTSGHDDPYLSPERRSGAPRSVEADVYSLGVLLAELFRSATDGRYGPELASVLDRAASPDPSERASNAAELLAAVRQAALAPSATERAASWISGALRNPYKGLRAFEEADAADFFGREALVGQLVERMAELHATPRLLAVVGPSGSGKSSVVNAGLVPALRAGALPGSERWFAVTMTPGHHPFEELERALLSVAVNAPASLLERLHDGGGLGPALDHVLPEGGGLLLVIDQFEELYTLSDARARRRFLDLLGRTLDEPASRVSIVITLRADFYDRPLRHDTFGRHLASRTHAVPPMTPEELGRAVGEPAERAGLRLEPGLLARIVAEMSDRPGALPLLQYALSELWEHRDGSRLSLAGYEASGGIAGAVSRRAESLITQLDDDGREQGRQLLLRLVEPGEGAPDTARKVRLGELERLSTHVALMDDVVESFARYRLLLIDRDPDTREPTLELAHEALLRAWPRLQQWVDDARDDLRTQRRLAAAAQQWLEGGRDPSFLLTGSRLQQAEAWASSSDIRLGPETQEYLAASIAERRRLEAEEEQRIAREATLERRALVRLRALVVVLGLGALLAGALSVYALRQSDRAAGEARIASARELAAAAVANLDVDAERSVLLALEAVRVTRSVDGTVLREAEEALHRSVVAARVVLTVPDEGGELDWTRTPDGRSVFVTQGPEESGTITIRDAATGDAIASWHGHDVDVNDVAFSRDGSMLATTGDDGMLKVWRIADRTLLGEVAGRGQVWGPSFSHDGSMVAAAWPEERMVRILDRQSGSVRELKNLDGATQATSFSPDGRQLAAAPVEGSVEVVDVRTLDPILTLKAEGIDADLFGFEIAYSPDGRWLASASLDGAAKLWDARTGTLRYSLAGHSGSVMSLAWADDSAHLVTGGQDGQAIVWEVGEAGYRRVLSIASQDLPGGIAGAAFERGGDRILLGGNIVQAVKIFDVGLRGDEERLNLRGDPNGIDPLAFTSNTTLAVTAGDGSVAIWDTATGAQRSTIATDNPDNPLFAMDASPDGRILAISGPDSNRLIDTSTGAPIRRGTRTYTALAWSADGQRIAAANSFEAPNVDILDRAGTILRESQGDAAFFAWDVDIRNDGLVAVAEWPRGRPDPSVHRVTLRDSGTGQVVRTLSTPGLGYSLAFDPTGDRLALTFLDGRAEIWDLGSDRRIVLAGQIGDNRDLTFSRDGSRIATAGDDGTIRVWDARTGTPQLVLRGHTAAVSRVRFAPDGRTLASAGADGVTRVWALQLDDLIDTAHRNITRQLTQPECLEFLHLDPCPADAR